ncbi:hypothetical protein E2C01_065941 [Portunus trituberculatus]|uniref:Uncharacterized protein n=1 Tax=Portunus trituberculatus TaxID=210409 RepID=A0A5B7HNY2_PORTR|nr:hypothetical protein [Portunus trituberculatus]
MVEAPEDFVIEKITQLVDKIDDTGNILERKEESEFIVIPKKEGAVRTMWKTSDDKYHEPGGKDCTEGDG